MFSVTPDLQTATLDTFGGLVTGASPESLPEGASPRLYDVDFLIAEVGTRAGLDPRFTYSGASAGPNGGGHAANQGAGPAWSDPGNILLNDGSYAVATLVSSGSAASPTSTGSNTGGGVAWTNPTNIDSATTPATVSLS